MKSLYRQLHPVLSKHILDRSACTQKAILNRSLATSGVSQGIQHKTQPLNGAPLGLFGARHQSTESTSHDLLTSKSGALLAPLDELTDEERAIKDAARRFAEEKIAPLSKQMDETGSIPRDLIDELFANGFMAVTVPEKYGGSGASFRAMTEVVWEVSKADMGVGTLVIVHNTLICRTLMELGSKELQDLYLPQMALSKVGSICISEDIAGSDAYAMRTTATKDGDDYILNGSKMWISSADVSDFFLVYANVDLSKGYRGITLFLVERNMPGFTVGKNLDKLGLRSSGTAPIFFDNVRVPSRNVIGEVGQAYRYALEKLGEGRICAGVQSVAVANAALDYTVRYLNERKQFGKRIWEFQAIQHQVVEALIQLESSKLLIHDTIRRLEAGKPYTRQACMAKYSGTETGRVITSKCVEWMGGVGFTKAYPVEKFYRDAPIGVIYEGTSNIQLNTIAKFWEKENFQLD